MTSKQQPAGNNNKDAVEKRAFHGFRLGGGVKKEELNKLSIFGRRVTLPVRTKKSAYFWAVL